MSLKDRKKLHNPKQKMKPDAVVAADGSGKIYVKKGVYHENVKVGREKWNVMLYGDGMDKTIVSSNLSNATGSSTSSSATFAAFGKGFIARDMGFKNTAGAANHQAVALLSASDQSVFYRCLIDAYQDSLSADNIAGVEAFLGRPWRDYSTTIVMESQMENLIDPKGWQPWNRRTPFPDTIFYVEYNNAGPGAVTTKRIRQKGVRVNNTRNDARKFTVRSFIHGVQWLPSTGVPFQADL